MYIRKSKTYFTDIFNVYFYQIHDELGLFGSAVLMPFYQLSDQ